MKIKKIGILSLAIGLIGVGTIFFLHNFLSFDLLKVFNIFFSSLIILFGLENIFIKLVASKSEEQTIVKIDVKSVVLLIFISIITLGIVGIGNITDKIFNRQYYLTPHDEYTNNIVLDNPTNELVIDAEHTSINLTESKDDNIEITTSIILSKNKDIDTSNIKDDIITINENNNNQTIIKTNITDLLNTYPDLMSIDASLDISIPKQMIVNIKNKRGEIYASNLKNKINLNGDNTTITCKNISEDLNINSFQGYIRCDNIEKNLNIKNEHDDIYLYNINGISNIDCSHGTIYGENIFNDIIIKGEHNSYILDNIDGNITASSTFESCEINNANKKIDLVMTNGNILVQNAYNGININSSISSIDIINSSHLTENDIIIRNKQGDISIVNHPNQKGDYNLSTEFGEINTYFDQEINKIIENNSQEAQFTIGDDSQMKFDIINDHGDININQN